MKKAVLLDYLKRIKDDEVFQKFKITDKEYEKFLNLDELLIQKLMEDAKKPSYSPSNYSPFIIMLEYEGKEMYEALDLYFKYHRLDKILLYKKIRGSSKALEMSKFIVENDFYDIFVGYASFANFILENLDCDKELLKKYLEVLKGRKNKDYMISVLSSKDAIEAGIAIEGAKLVSQTHDLKFETGLQGISGVKFDSSMIEYTTKILINPIAIKAGIAIDGAKIISEVKRYREAEYIYNILTNEDAIDAGIALDGAKLILELKESNFAYATNILTNKDVIDAGIALDVIRILKQSDTHFYYGEVLLKNKFLIDEGIALEVIQEISNYNSLKHDLDLTCQILSDPYFIKEGLAFILVRIINGVDEDENIDKLLNLVNTEEKISALFLKEISIVGTEYVQDNNQYSWRLQGYKKILDLFKDHVKPNNFLENNLELAEQSYIDYLINAVKFSNNEDIDCNKLVRFNK